MKDEDYWVRKEHGKRLFWGVMLIVLGVIAGLDYFGAFPWPLGTTTWPVILIVLGAVRAGTAWSARKLGGGVTMMLAGTVCLIAANHWYGYTWRNSWPLALIAMGIGMVVHALAVPFYRRHEDGVVNVDAR